MNRTVKVLLFVFLCVLGMHLFAQKAAKGKGSTKIFKPTVYLDHSDYCGGPIQKRVFDSLLKMGLTSHDQSGNSFKVISFDLTYAEQNLYEDSIGNLEVLMDYSHEFCPGNMVTSYIDSSLYKRTKAGDTVFMDNIQVVDFDKKTKQPLPDSSAFSGKGMKFVIVR